MRGAGGVVGGAPVAQRPTDESFFVSGNLCRAMCRRECCRATDFFCRRKCCRAVGFLSSRGLSSSWVLSSGVSSSSCFFVVQVVVEQLFFVVGVVGLLVCVVVVVDVGAGLVVVKVVKVVGHGAVGGSDGRFDLVLWRRDGLEVGWKASIYRQAGSPLQIG